MATSGRHRAPAPSASRPRKEPEAESKLARKISCVDALKKIHSDRPVQAYNELVQKAEDDLQLLWQNNKGSTVDRFAQLLQKLCATNHVSWTKVHFDRLRSGAAASRRPDTPQPRPQPEAGCLSLDPNHWSAPVAQAPVKIENLETGESAFKSTISLHTAEAGPAILASIKLSLIHI